MPKKKGTKMDNAQDPNNPLDMVMAQPNRQVEILDLAATHQKLEASQAATTTLEPFASPHACVESEAAASGPAAPPSREGEGAAVTSSSVETALSSIRRSAETKKILLLKAKEEAQMKAEERKKNAEEQHQARRKAEEEVEARKKKAGEEKVARPSQKSSIVTFIGNSLGHWLLGMCGRHTAVAVFADQPVVCGRQDGGDLRGPAAVPV